MMKLRIEQFRTGRTFLALVLVACGIGVSLVADRVTSLSDLRPGAALAGAGDRVTVVSATPLSLGLPLFLDSGVVHSVDQAGVSATDPIARLTVEGGTFRLPLIEGNAGPAETGSPSEPLLAQLSAMNFGQLAIRKSRLLVVAAHGSTTTLNDLTLDLVPSRKGAFTLKGSATFRGQTVKIDLAAGAPAGEARQAAKARAVNLPVKLTIRSGLLDAAIEGRFVAGEGLKLAGEADLRARRLRDLAQWLGLDVPNGSDLRDASLVGALDWSAGVMAFRKVTLVVDGNRGEGALLLRLGGERPAIDGTLDFRSFDVAPHLAAQMAPEAKPVATEKPTKSGSLAMALDADLRLSMAKIKIAGVETGRAAAAITLKSGKMQAELAELEIEGGVARGQATLDVFGDLPKLGLKAKLTGIDPGRVVTDFLKRNPLMGRANITLDGVGHGHSLPDMLADFTGKAAVSVPEGGRIGIDLKALIYSARNARHVGWAAAGKGSTSIDALDARVQITKGAITIEDAAARSGPLLIGSAGKIDLPGRLLDLTVGMRQNDQAAKAPTDILVIRGSWSDPAISLQGRPFTSPAPTAKDGTAVAAPVPGAPPRR